MSKQRTVEQDRASQAWKDVGQVKNTGYKSKYLALARSAPADIQSNGLGQTLAFWKAKHESEHSALGGHVSAWVCQQMKWENPGQQKPDLLAFLIQKTSQEYRRATVEALAYLVWIKRFAEAELE